MKGWFTANLVTTTDPVKKQTSTAPDFKGVTDQMAWVVTASSNTECILMVAAPQATQTKLGAAGLKSWGADSSDPNFIKTLQTEAARLGNLNWSRGGYFIYDPSPNS